MPFASPPFAPPLGAAAGMGAGADGGVGGGAVVGTVVGTGTGTGTGTGLSGVGLMVTTLRWRAKAGREGSPPTSRALAWIGLAMLLS